MKNMNYDMRIMPDILKMDDTELTVQQRHSIEEFVIVAMECDADMLNGIDRQIPMTDALYHRTISKLMELGADWTLHDFIDCFGGQFGD